MLIEVLGLIGLILLGLLIILIIKLLFMLVPAAIVALIVWLLTGSTWLAGIAFLIVAALSILKVLWRKTSQELKVNLLLLSF